MRIHTILVGLFIGLTLSNVSHADDYQKLCSEDGRMVHFKWCASEDYIALDKQLNTQYQALIRCWRVEPGLWDNAQDRDEMIAKLRATQRTWVKQRDSDCNLVEWADRGGGRMQGMESLECRQQLTRTRIRFFQQLNRCG